MLTWRKALIVVGISFSLLDSACILGPQEADCSYITPYKQTKGICSEDILHHFTVFPKGNNWLKLDSVKNWADYKLFSSPENFKNIYLAKGDFNLYFDIYFTQTKTKSICTECPTQVKYANRSSFYKIENEILVTLKTNRENTKSPFYTEQDWPEYIEISTPDFGNLNHIPGVIKLNYKPNKLIPNFSINGKVYSDVIYVYDSLSMNNLEKTLVEAYYSPSFGLLKYSFSNGEVYTLQKSK